jgi:hypothetical protein
MRTVKLELAAEHVAPFRSLVQWCMSSPAEELGDVVCDWATGTSMERSPVELLAGLNEMAELLSVIGWAYDTEDKAATLEMPDYAAIRVLRYGDDMHLRSEIDHFVGLGEHDKALALVSFHKWVKEQLAELDAVPA